MGRIGDGVRAEESLKEKGRSAKNLQGDESGEDEDEEEKK